MKDVTETARTGHLSPTVWHAQVRQQIAAMEQAQIELRELRRYAYAADNPALYLRLLTYTEKSEINVLHARD